VKVLEIVCLRKPAKQPYLWAFKHYDRAEINSELINRFTCL